MTKYHKQYRATSDRMPGLIFYYKKGGNYTHLSNYKHLWTLSKHYGALKWWDYVKNTAVISTWWNQTKK